jgi:hypothetical protein
MKVAICLIIKNENEYLEEWLQHHRNLGFNYFIIYDNNSSFSVENYLKINNNDNKDIAIYHWKDNEHASQLRAYKHCCDNFKELYDYILFIDTDEFLMLKHHKTIQEFIDSKPKFDGFGIYWRMYGMNMTNSRIPIKDYKLYSYDNHIKSILNPKKVIRFLDPHKATLEKNNVYIDELNRNIISPIGLHTSKEIYIKHTWTRSLSEWNEKLKRGSGDKVVRNYTEKEFIDYNKQCVLHD